MQKTVFLVRVWDKLQMNILMLFYGVYKKNVCAIDISLTKS